MQDNAQITCDNILSNIPVLKITEDKPNLRKGKGGRAYCNTRMQGLNTGWISRLHYPK